MCSRRSRAAISASWPTTAPFSRKRPGQGLQAVPVQWRIAENGWESVRGLLRKQQRLRLVRLPRRRQPEVHLQCRDWVILLQQGIKVPLCGDSHSCAYASACAVSDVGRDEEEEGEQEGQE